MTKKRTGGTLSTRGSSDKKSIALAAKPEKEAKVVQKMKSLLGQNKLTISSHANKRMGERNVIYYEVLQALTSGKHVPSRDRLSTEHNSWEYTIEGKTKDERDLRLGIAFDTDHKSKETLLLVTVIDLKKEV